MNLNFLKPRLERAPRLATAIFAGFAAFSTYLCVYAFRKPFAAADFETGPQLLGLEFKSILVISQVAGYALSKFLGIKFVSESKANYRAPLILGLVVVAEIALALFWVVPMKLKLLCLFLNGIPLGMIWGLVFSYLEGRRLTEVMGLILCASFEFGSGLTKDVGKYLMEHNRVSDFGMPFLTGLCFFIPLIISLWLMEQIPNPTEEDQAERTRREPMFAGDRRNVFREFAIGLVLLITAYTLLTAYRDFRDNFMAEILTESRGSETDFQFSNITTPVSIGLLFLMMFLARFKNNFAAFAVNHGVIFLGIATVGVSTWAFQNTMISDQWWLVLTGFGTYAAYIPFNCILFERLIAAFQKVSNAAFYIYVADAFGYLGAVSVLIYKDFGAANLSWLQFFGNFSYVLAVSGCLLTIGSFVYFSRQYKQSVQLTS